MDQSSTSPPAPPLPGEGHGEGSLQDCAPAWLLEHFDRLHPVAPVWPRELPSLRRLDGLRGVARRVGGRPTAYALVEPDGAGGGVVHDLAAETPADAVRVLAALQQRYRRLVCANEPEDSPVLDAFRAAGFRLTHERYEMLVDLA